MSNHADIQRPIATGVTSPWKYLTDEELEQVLGFSEHTTESTRFTLTVIARAIEEKAREKNQ